MDEDCGRRWVPSPLDGKCFFLLSGCESRDLQTKPSWIYFQSERGTDDGEGARFREDRVSKKMDRCFPRKNTPKKHVRVYYEYHSVHVTKAQPDTMLPFATRQKDVVKQVHKSKN